MHLFNSVTCQNNIDIHRLKSKKVKKRQIVQQLVFLTRNFLIINHLSLLFTGKSLKISTVSFPVAYTRTLFKFSSLQDQNPHLVATV